MFFRQPAKPGDGIVTSVKPKGGVAFGNLIGEDEAKELFKDVQKDVADFKTTSDSIIKESLEDMPVIQAFRGLLFEETSPSEPEPLPDEKIPLPNEQVPLPPMPDNSAGTWPIPMPKIPPMPPPLPPRMPRRPPEDKVKRPIPKAPAPVPIPEARIPESVPLPEPKIPDESEASPLPNPPISLPDEKTAEAEDRLLKIIKALEELALALDAMGQDILKKVDVLETTVKSRGDEIREDVKNMHMDALEFSRKIKDNMHAAELKDLEIQERTMKMIDAAEDRVLERAVKAQGLFGNKGSTF
jgi:hypothetical protein